MVREDVQSFVTTYYCVKETLHTQENTVSFVHMNDCRLQTDQNIRSNDSCSTNKIVFFITSLFTLS